MVIGNLDGRLAAAARIAMDRGVPVRHADRIETALALVRAGRSADLLMVDVAADICSLAAQLRVAGIPAPIVACGTRHDAGTAAAAVQAGAREYIPLPPDAEVIAAILAAVHDDGRPPCPDPGEGRADPGSAMTGGADADMATPSLVGRTVADVERDLILETLRRCLGNRTHAAAILGISVRTLRNKLAVYAAEGLDVPPPSNGEIRGAA